jgi:hypothetical protein
MTICALSMVTVHVLVVPEQPPPIQLPKVYPLRGVAVRVTFVPLGNAFAHVEPRVPQEIPEGLEVRLPCPDTEVESVYVDAVARVPPLDTVLPSALRYAPADQPSGAVV